MHLPVEEDHPVAAGIADGFDIESPIEIVVVMYGRIGEEMESLDLGAPMTQIGADYGSDIGVVAVVAADHAPEVVGGIVVSRELPVDDVHRCCRR